MDTDVTLQSGTHILNEEACRRIAALPNVKRLNLQSTNIQDDWLEMIGSIARLEDLNVGHTKVTDAGMPKLAGLRNLRKLTVAGTKVTGEALAALPCAAKLREVSIAGVGRRSGDADLEAVLEGCTALEWLSVESTVSAAALQGIGRLRVLRELLLKQTTITPAHMEHLATVPLLAILGLGDCQVEDAAWAALPALKQLTTLNLKNVPHTPAMEAALKKFNPPLKVVETSGAEGGAPEGHAQASAATSATPATATKDAPFVNTLAMKFVPVPIIGGPTNGRRVLFSVWETRAQDYEVFVKDKKQEWDKQDFDLGPTHPAVRVSWSHAKAFCAWLTQRERSAGKLGANETYRLPSDHEWSCAAGIGEREDAARRPSEKDRKLVDVFPWGTNWPPPEQSGNYWSDELHPLIEQGRFPNMSGRGLTKRKDGHATTAPVGSYPANHLGLHDLGGNLWEWCEDRFDDTSQNLVGRGGSWNAMDRDTLGSSARYPVQLHTSSPDRGFRCVLAVGGGANGEAVGQAPRLPVSDAPTTAGGALALQAATANRYPVGRWVRPYQKAADIHQKWFDVGAKWEEGWITPGAGFNQGIVLTAPNGQGRNWGARAKIRCGGGSACIVLRRNGTATSNTVSNYEFRVTVKGGAEFVRGQGRGSVSGSDRKPLGDPFPIPLTEGQEVLIEAFAIGDTLYGRVEGKVFTMKTDGVLKEGGFEVATQIMAVRDIEFINLDGLSEAEAKKAAGVDTP